MLKQLWTRKHQRQRRLSLGNDLWEKKWFHELSIGTSKYITCVWLQQMNQKKKKHDGPKYHMYQTKLLTIQWITSSFPIPLAKGTLKQATPNPKKKKSARWDSILNYVELQSQKSQSPYSQTHDSLSCIFGAIKKLISKWTPLYALHLSPFLPPLFGLGLWRTLFPNFIEVEPKLLCNKQNSHLNASTR